MSAQTNELENYMTTSPTPDVAALREALIEQVADILREVSKCVGDAEKISYMKKSHEEIALLRHCLVTINGGFVKLAKLSTPAPQVVVMEESLKEQFDNYHADMCATAFNKQCNCGLSKLVTAALAHREENNPKKEHNFPSPFGACKDCGFFVEECIDKRYCDPSNPKRK